MQSVPNGRELPPLPAGMEGSHPIDDELVGLPSHPSLLLNNNNNNNMGGAGSLVDL